jgi:hypothetical protein
LKGGIFKMKAWHWALVLVAGYEGLVGISELVASSGASSSNPLGALATAPSVGSFVQSSLASSGTAAVSNSTAGFVDLGVAALLFVFPLHKHLTA